MRLTSEELQQLYQAETARLARGHKSDCLTAEMLTRAAAGEPSRVEREWIADHLATCSSCSAEYREVRAVRTWAERVSDTGYDSPKEVVASSIKLVAPAFQPLPQQARPFYVPYAIAAALLILTVILGAQLISQRRENQRLVAQVNEARSEQERTNGEALQFVAESKRRLEEATKRAQQEQSKSQRAQEELTKLSAQQKLPARVGGKRAENQSSSVYLNVPIFELDPRGAGRGQDDAVTTVTVPRGTDLFTLLLNITGEDSLSAYSLEVLDRSGSRIWVGRGLRKSPYNNFTVALSRRALPAGEYQLKLYGMRNGRKEMVQQYAIRLTYS
jgi:hypothetical protein